jgi:hypothetical protein
MSDFIPIPDSQINLEFSYLENVTFVQRALPIEFDDNTITAYVHHYEYDEDGPKSVFGNLPLNYTLISKTPKMVSGTFIKLRVLIEFRRYW